MIVNALSTLLIVTTLISGAPTGTEEKQSISPILCMTTNHFFDKYVNSENLKPAFLSLDLYESDNIVKITYANKKRVMVSTRHYIATNLTCVLDVSKDTSATFPFQLFNDEAKI